MMTGSKAPVAPKIIALVLVVAVGVIAWIVVRPGPGSLRSPGAERPSGASGENASPTADGRPDPTSAPPSRPAAATERDNAVRSGTPSRPEGSAPPEPVDLGAALLEAKKLEEARVALRAGDPKRALAELDSYERVVRGPGSLRQEAVVLRIEALARSRRRSDARALAIASRDDPAYASVRDRIEAVLADAGL